MKQKRRTRLSLPAIFGWLGSFVVFIPLYIIVVNSFKDRQLMNHNPLSWPASWNFGNYFEAIDMMGFVNAFKNSIIITIFSVICILLIGGMAAWVLTRDHSRKSKILFAIIVAIMLVPFQSIMIPLVQYMTKIKQIIGVPMLNTYYGVVFLYVGFGLSMCIFLCHGFIKSIPIELEEAAMIDGCNRWQTYWRIIFPNLTSIGMTVAILDVIWIWNDYLMPSLVLADPDKRTIQLSTFYFFGQYNIEWNLALAGLVLTILPVVIFYIFAQKYIIEGTVAGAVKG